MQRKFLVARELRVRLARRNMSMSALARVLGCSPSTLTRWHQRALTVPPEMQRAIAAELGGTRGLFEPAPHSPITKQ
jgi:transcriptional regulator with XRE-family HTH domain